MRYNPEQLKQERLEQETEGRAAHFESTYTLKPNEEYEVNRYHYQTDCLGRIVSCEGALRLEEGKRNTAHQTRAGGEYRLDSDQGGHLIGRQFGGSEKIDNIVAMDFDVNNYEWKKMEKAWADRLEQQCKVDVNIRCHYEADSQRPSSFTVISRVTYPDGYVDHSYCRIQNTGGKAS